MRLHATQCTLSCGQIVWYYENVIIIIPHTGITVAYIPPSSRFIFAMNEIHADRNGKVATTNKHRKIQRIETMKEKIATV